ncbi:hypothetical protein [Terrisporobacter sp.]
MDINSDMEESFYKKIATNIQFININSNKKNILIIEDKNCSGLKLILYEISKQLEKLYDNKILIVNYNNEFSDNTDEYVINNIDENIDLLKFNRIYIKLQQDKDYIDIKKYIKSIEDKYDYILIPGKYNDIKKYYKFLISLCDGSIVLVEYNKSRKRDLLDINDKLRKCNISILGVILNNVK